MTTLELSDSAAHEACIRRLAKAYGLALQKSRRAADWGAFGAGYRLIDPNRNLIMGPHSHWNDTATLDEIECFLTEDEVAVTDST